MTYIEKAQRRWELLNHIEREALMLSLGCTEYESRTFKGSFDLYGDMPSRVSTKLVRHFLYN